jgi:hypothetical protein
MNKEFSSSMFFGGSAATPQRIIVSDQLITFKQNTGARRLFLASNSVTIARKSVVGVEIRGKLIGCDIIITTNGGATIKAECFDTDDAHQLQRLLLGV